MSHPNSFRIPNEAPVRNGTTPHIGYDVVLKRDVQRHVLAELKSGALDNRKLGIAVDSFLANNTELGLAYLGYTGEHARKNLSETSLIELATWLSERMTSANAESQTDQAPKVGLGKRVLSFAAFAFAAYALGNSYIPEHWRSTIVDSVGKAVAFVRTGAELTANNPELASKLAGGGIVTAMLYAWLRTFLNPALAAVVMFVFRTGVCVPAAALCYGMFAAAAGATYVSNGVKARSDKTLAASVAQARCLVPKNGMKALSGLRLKRQAVA